MSEFSPGPQRRDETKQTVYYYPVPGPPGKDGQDGEDGLNGLPGRDGLDGAPGAPGRRGSIWFVSSPATPT